MKRDFLEKMGLSKDQIDQILDANMKEIGDEKAKRTAAEDNAKALTGQLEASQAELAKIQKSGTDAEALKSQVAELQEKIKTESEAHAKAMHDKDIDIAVDKAIREAGGLNSKAIKALLEDADAFDFDKDGNIKGLADQLKTLSEADDSKMLFKTNTAPTFVGMTPASGTADLATGEDNLFFSAAMKGAGLGSNDD